MDDNYGVTPEGTCEKCGAELFSVVPNETTEEEIIRFAQKAAGWRENPDALSGWMPSGVYCPNGCVAVHADYPPPWPPEEQTPPELETDGRADFIWAVITMALVLAAIIIAVAINYDHVSWLGVAANLAVLILGTVIVSALDAWVEAKIRRTPAQFHPPFLAVFVVTIGGGILTLFFGWTSTIIILIALVCISAVFRLLARND